ncbi:MAG TPA: cytochrome P450, partial [Acidimicrobiales bacterium]|nr:cytochrome P450 [Acidimicrobiales bacterium]
SDQLREWSGLLVRTLEPLVDPALITAIGEAGEAMRAFTADVIAWKRSQPGDDLLSALIGAEEAGDVLSDQELLQQVMLLYIAGHETTVNLIGNGMLALLRHPDQLDRLRADPSLDPNAVEELLRYDSPVQMSRRITLGPVEVAGQVIEPGAFVALVLASANRDTAHWGETAVDLDVGRDGAHQHLSFGGGAHYCLGAALARLEGQVAIGRLARRFPRLELADGVEWNGRLNLRGLTRLPVEVRARA